MEWPYPHFSVEEMQCKCGCEGLPDYCFMGTLEAIRIDVGFPMPVTSGYRCPEYNDKVSTSGRDGPHTIGAADIAVSGERAFAVVQSAINHGILGIGIAQKGNLNQRFIHLDRARAIRSIWSY